MRVEQQGHNECMLATIAALTGESLADVRYVACGLTYVRHWACVVDPDTFWAAVSDIVCFLDRADLQPHVCLNSRIMPTSSIRLLDRDIDALPDIGRGSVVASGEPWEHHIMPWENGLVYDPNDPETPMTLADVRKLGVTIQRISCEA